MTNIVAVGMMFTDCERLKGRPSFDFNHQGHQTDLGEKDGGFTRYVKKLSGILHKVRSLEGC